MINIPIGIYNNPPVVEEIRADLIGTRTLTDSAGNTLKLEVEPDRLLIVPESYGALMHYAYDAGTLHKRDRRGHERHNAGGGHRLRDDRHEPV